MFVQSSIARPVTRQAGPLVLGAAALLAAVGMHAQPIALVNPSFESPDVTPDPNDPGNPLNGVSPEIDDWMETGPVDPVFMTTIDTGVFFNVPIPLDPPIDFGPPVGELSMLPPVGNADGNNLAFLVINRDADGVGEEQVGIWQESAEDYQAMTPYAFTLSIGPSVTGPPSDPTTSVVLSLGYLDPVGGDFVSIASQVVTAAELNNPFDPALLLDPSYPLLKDFTVAGFGAPSALGNEIVVKATLVNSAAPDLEGGFIVDNARLRELIPGDLDYDGDVDDADFGLAFAAFTGPGPTTADLLADLDRDSDVDDADYGLLFANFTGPGVPAAAVPEPASMALLALGGVALLRRRR